MDNNDRADEVRSTRKRRGWTQPQLAEAAGLKERTIRNLEKGLNVSQATERAVYRALGLNGAPTWPEDVEAFLQMVGYRLTSVSDRERDDLIGRITRLLIGR